MSADPLAELRIRFRERARGDADALEAALSDGDHNRIEDLAHGLAGAAGLFGFTDVGGLAKAIDGRFAEGQRPSTDEIEALISAIRRDMAAYS